MSHLRLPIGGTYDLDVAASAWQSATVLLHSVSQNQRGIVSVKCPPPFQSQLLVKFPR